MSEQSETTKPLMIGNPIGRKEQFDYAIKLFQYHADQRIKSFNFYVILLAASIGGTISVFSNASLKCTLVIILLGFWHILLATLFWGIDSRSISLVKVSTDALKWFENQPEWDNPHIKMITEDGKRQEIRFHGLISYTNAFKITFKIHILFGMSVIVVGVFKACNLSTLILP